MRWTPSRSSASIVAARSGSTCCDQTGAGNSYCTLERVNTATAPELGGATRKSAMDVPAGHCGRRDGRRPLG